MPLHPRPTQTQKRESASLRGKHKVVCARALHAISIAVVSSLALVSSAHSEVLAVGDPTCAQVIVTADVSDQIEVNGYANDWVSQSRISLDVLHVEYGKIKKGKHSVYFISHAQLDESRSPFKFYLNRDKNGDWWVSDCYHR